MQYLGDIELVGSSILNCKIERVNALPTFTVNDESRLIYVIGVPPATGQYYCNNGSQWIPFQFASQDSEPLIATLGNNWINGDYTFNPANFNALGFMTGLPALTSTDSLFTVIQRLDEALGNFSSIDINDITGFEVVSPTAGDIIYFNGTNYVNAPITNIPDFAINISLDNLTDVNIPTTPTNNEGIYFDSSTNKFVNKKLFYIFEDLSGTQSTHTITHNLNQLYCTVTIFDTVAKALITPTAVIYNNASQLSVTVTGTPSVIIYVTTVPRFVVG